MEFLRIILKLDFESNVSKITSSNMITTNPREISLELLIQNVQELPTPCFRLEMCTIKKILRCDTEKGL